MIELVRVWFSDANAVVRDQLRIGTQARLDAPARDHRPPGQGRGRLHDHFARAHGRRPGVDAARRERDRQPALPGPPGRRHHFRRCRMHPGRVRRGVRAGARAAIRVVAERWTLRPCISGSADTAELAPKGASIGRDHQDREADQVVRLPPRDRRRRPRGPAGRGLRLPRSQRRRQDDDHPRPARPDPADRRQGLGLRHRHDGRSGRHPPTGRLPARRVHPLRQAHRRRHARVLRQSARRSRSRITRPGSSSASTWTRHASSRSTPRATSRRSAWSPRCSTSPDLLVLDEPTSGLDPLVQQTFFAVLREAVAGGRTVFLSSHVLSEAEKSCDRVAIIRDGRIVMVDRVDALRDLAAHQVELRFTGPVPAAEFEKIPGVSGVVAEDHVLRMHVAGPIAPVVKAAARYRARRLRVARAQSRGDVPGPVQPAGRGGERIMSANSTRARVLMPAPRTRPWSRVYGLGSIYAKTMRDSRLAFIVMAGLLGGVMFVVGAAIPERFSRRRPLGPKWCAWPTTWAPWPRGSPAARSTSAPWAVMCPGSTALSSWSSLRCGRSWRCRPRSLAKPGAAASSSWPSRRSASGASRSRSWPRT